MDFLLTNDRKRELYEATIQNIDRSVNDYMQTKLTLERERLENKFLAELLKRDYVEDERVIEQISELQKWIDQLKEQKHAVMMSFMSMGL